MRALTKFVVMPMYTFPDGDVILYTEPMPVARLAGPRDWCGLSSRNRPFSHASNVVVSILAAREYTSAPISLALCVLRALR